MLKIIKFLAILLGAILGLSAPVGIAHSASAQTIKTDNGRVSGTVSHGIAAFKGVPFAAPPVGDLRWRRPQLVTPWTGVRKARAFAPACMQSNVSMPGETPPPVSEDCLYLNIWTPTGKGVGRLPVLVWIHGGGFSSGYSAMPLYWGDRLAKKGIIVVTIAYRLGVLGFLAHPGLSAESPDHSSGNYGLMDQVAALEWVQRNISAFGGDPAQVTIAGQSAGSMSVSLLLASPRARGLFARAIGESGGVFEPVQLAPRFALATAEVEGAAYAATLKAGSVTELRHMRAAALMGNMTGQLSHPVIEPYMLPRTPYDAYCAGLEADVPVLMGSNAEEARSLTDVSEVRAADFDTGIARSFGPLPPALTTAYPHASDAQAKQARLHARQGKTPVYYYLFAHQPPFPSTGAQANWGASHFAELWYVFDHLDQEAWDWHAADRILAARISDYWVNFVKSGNPNGPLVPPWPAYRGEDAEVMHLDTPMTVGGVGGIEGLRGFDVIYEQLRGKPCGQ